MTASDLSMELVIPSYNRLAVLRSTVKQIRTLYPDLGICLGLQGELPDARWQAELAKDANIRVKTYTVPSTTRTLNDCITTSLADVVLLLDDDAVPHFGWLETHKAAFQKDQRLAYTSGRVVEFRRWRSSFSDWFRIMVEWLVGPFLANDKKIGGRVVSWITRWGLILTNQHLPGSCRINSPREGNMGIRRSDFASAGGFDPFFVGNAWGFGADFGLRLAKQGKLGLYLGDAIIIHHEVPSGGSRQANRRQWYRDFISNHRILIRSLGPLGWIGSLPRIAKKALWLLFHR